MTKHICLILHCLKDSRSGQPRVNDNLFVDVKEVENLVLELKDRGFKFGIPGEIRRDDPPTCCFTFDDGYYNNHLFLPIAKKYKIPFILFVNSYNIQRQLPYLWDVKGLKEEDKWSFNRDSYLDLYREVAKNHFEELRSDSHRPFTAKELNVFLSNPFARVALHTHCHQPLVGKYSKVIENDLNKNEDFVKGFSNNLSSDFAFPCGLYTKNILKNLLNRYERVYTADGGGFSYQDKVISRVSLVAPRAEFHLMNQIERSFSLQRKILRIATVFKYSNSFLSMY